MYAVDSRSTSRLACPDPRTLRKLLPLYDDSSFFLWDLFELADSNEGRAMSLTYAEARDDLRTWWPKLRVGGLLSGHDYQFQYQARGDGYTFGVKDAVDEFAAARNLRVYSTSESYLPSFYFLKCEPG